MFRPQLVLQMWIVLQSICQLLFLAGFIDAIAGGGGFIWLFSCRSARCFNISRHDFYAQSDSDGAAVSLGAGCCLAVLAAGIWHGDFLVAMGLLSH